MIRRTAVALLGLASAVALIVAQEPASKSKDATPMQPGAKKAAQAEDAPQGPAAAAGESAAEIVKRLQQNLEEVEGRLGKKDPRDQTQKIQDQILRDLDELIKQKNPNC